MIYIVFLVTSFINIFNIVIIGDNKLKQTVKEKLLLITYSIAELLFVLVILNFIELSSTNLILILSFIIIWLLSKSYICILNMNFENVDMGGANDMEYINDKQIINDEELILGNDVLDDGLEKIEEKISFAKQGEKESEAIVDEQEEQVIKSIFDEQETIEQVKGTEQQEETANNQSLIKEEIIDNTVIDETQIITEVDFNKLELSDIVQTSANNKEKIITHNSLYDLADIVRNDEVNKDEERKMRRRSLALKATKMQGDRY